MVACNCYCKMQKTSLNSHIQPFQLPVLVLDLCLLMQRLSKWVIDLQDFILRPWSLLFFPFTFSSFKLEADFDVSHQHTGVTEKKDARKLSSEDAKMVMRKLGISCSQEGEELEKLISEDKLPELFDECEPSLEELKEAFDIFDRNGDGFIDAMELQRVLHELGLKVVAGLQDCEKMIRNCDQNKDGRIDFKEFVRLMEATIC